MTKFIKSEPDMVSDILHNGGLDNLENYKIFIRKFPKRKHLPVRTLNNWYLDISMNENTNPNVYLFGTLTKTVIRTSRIISVISPKKIVTKDCIYILGNSEMINKKVEGQPGIEQYFKDGFPIQWENIIKTEFNNKRMFNGSFLKNEEIKLKEEFRIREATAMNFQEGHSSITHIEEGINYSDKNEDNVFGQIIEEVKQDEWNDLTIEQVSLLKSDQTQDKRSNEKDLSDTSKMMACQSIESLGNPIESEEMINKSGNELKLIGLAETEEGNSVSIQTPNKKNTVDQSYETSLNDYFSKFENIDFKNLSIIQEPKKKIEMKKNTRNLSLPSLSPKKGFGGRRSLPNQLNQKEKNKIPITKIENSPDNDENSNSKLIKSISSKFKLLERKTQSPDFSSDESNKRAKIDVTVTEHNRTATITEIDDKQPKNSEENISMIGQIDSNDNSRIIHKITEKYKSLSLKTNELEIPNCKKEEILKSQQEETKKTVQESSVNSWSQESKGMGISKTSLAVSEDNIGNSSTLISAGNDSEILPDLEKINGQNKKKLSLRRKSIENPVTEAVSVKPSPKNIPKSINAQLKRSTLNSEIKEMIKLEDPTNSNGSTILSNNIIEIPELIKEPLIEELGNLKENNDSKINTDEIAEPDIDNKDEKTNLPPIKESSISISIPKNELSPLKIVSSLNSESSFIGNSDDKANKNKKGVKKRAKLLSFKKSKGTKRY